MSLYDQILVATNATDSHEEKCVVYDTARDWADLAGSNLKILHTVPQLGESGVEYALPSMSEIEEEILQEAEEEITLVASETGMESSKSSIAVGKLEDEILRQENVDLIVINNDNEHYWGSQAESILQSAQCDILAVNTES